MLVLVTLAEVGGAQTYVASLVPALTEHYDVTVAAWGPGPLRAAVERAGATYVPLEHVRRALHPVHDLLGLVELVRLLRRVRPAVVHANSSKAGILGRVAAALTRVPVRIFTVHGWAFKAHHGAAAQIYLWADRAARPLTTHMICVADAELTAGLRARTCRRSRTVVIRNAVDVTGAPVAQLAGRPPLVVSVGRLKEPKDFESLFRAAARVDGDFRLRVLGDGPDRPALERLLAELGLEQRVELAGDADDVPEQLAGADVFVLSSRSEGLPMSILEAMAAGLPVVATRVGGIPELVDDGRTGLLVGAGDVDALAEALQRLVDDPELRRTLGAAGRERAEAAFDLERFRREHLELYALALSPYRTRR